jgi:RND family efflux transporter MFP subunit
MGIRARSFSSLALAATTALWAGTGFAQATPPAVPTIVARAGGAVGSVELDGSLQAVRQATLAAQVGGNVLALPVKAGDRVRAGQALARIDERDVQSGLAQRDAAVAQAEAEARNARTHAERTRELQSRGFVSQAALDVAETQLKAAQAALQQAQAARAQAALARGFATVTAPFDALVLATHVEVGDLATPGRPIATVYAPGQMRAVVQIPSSRSAVARAAGKVEVQLPDGNWVAPVGRTVLPGADPVAQTVEWRLDLPPAASGGLLPGQAVRVRFEGAAAGAAPAGRLAVPTSAVLRRGELTAVYAVDGNRFVLKPVRLGPATGGSVEVLAGLKAGDRIAADPVRAGLTGATPQ